MYMHACILYIYRYVCVNFYIVYIINAHVLSYAIYCTRIPII